jgi:hypothetical protein
MANRIAAQEKGRALSTFVYYKSSSIAGADSKNDELRAAPRSGSLCSVIVEGGAARIEDVRRPGTSQEPHLLERVHERQKKITVTH